MTTSSDKATAKPKKGGNVRDGDIQEKGLKHRRLNELKADEAIEQIKEYTTHNKDNYYNE